MIEKRVHINNAGDIRTCNATKRPCRYGPEVHFATRAEAREAAERKSQGESHTFNTLRKKPKETSVPPKAKSKPAQAINLAEVEYCLRELGDPDKNDIRRNFMKQALNDALTFGKGGYEVDCFITRDENGHLTGAACLIGRGGSEESEFNDEDVLEDDLFFPRYKLLTYMGSTGGYGRRLAEACREQCASDGVPLYLETTKDSYSFWKHIGATEDPHGWGIGFYSFAEDV